MPAYALTGDFKPSKQQTVRNERGMQACAKCGATRFWLNDSMCCDCNPRPNEVWAIKQDVKLEGKRHEKTCAICNFVSERYGADPTFCAACDTRFELLRDPPAHCAICNLMAPYVVGHSIATFDRALVPDTDGWSRSFFPWPDTKSRREGVMAWPESQWLCPKDAAEVAKFIAHRRQPMRTEYENL